jgi:hypothetical protein
VFAMARSTNPKVRQLHHRRRVISRVFADGSRWGPTMVIATLAVPKQVFACSGVGAPETILRNEHLGWTLCVMTLLIAWAFAAILRLRSRSWRKQWPLLLLVLLHPGWWMSARSGDCGYTLRDGSILMTALTVLVACVMYWRVRRATGSASP